MIIQAKLKEWEKNSFEKISKFTWSEYGKNLVSFYNEILHK